MKLWIILLLTLTLPVFAQNDAKTEFQQANQLYQQGSFKQSAAKYEDIVSKGYASADLYYNLGNAYYRMNKIPEAILNFERAKKLAPSDDDVDFNLRIANLKTIDRIESVPSVFFMQWYYSIINAFSSGAWAGITIVFSWLTFISLALFMLLYTPAMKKLFFAIAAGCLVITICSMLIAGQAERNENSRSSAVVFSPSVYIKSSPDSQSTDLFILHEGTKVNILDSVGDWRKIRLANGNTGWLPSGSVEVI